MRPTKEEIETFVRESGAIAEEGFDLEDDVVKRHLEMAQIVAKSHRVGQVELVNATLCGIKDGWFRNSVSTGNMDRVPLVAHIPALHTQWRVFVDKGIECHISKPDEEKELFAWQVHDELL